MAQQPDEAGLIGVHGKLGYGRVHPFPLHVQWAHVIDFRFIYFTSNLNVINATVHRHSTRCQALLKCLAPALSTQFDKVPAKQHEPEQVEDATG